VSDGARGGEGRSAAGHAGGEAATPAAATSTATRTATGPGPGNAAAAPTSAEAGGGAHPGAGHPAPPVFSWPVFALALAGTFGAATAAPLAHTFFFDRLSMPGPLANGLAALVAALVGGAFGAIAARVGRRLAFYELAAVFVAWALAVAVVVAALPELRARSGALQALEAQGTLVLVLGLLGAGLLCAAAVFSGSTLAYLAVGGGRFDPSLSYELFVARSHLRLSPRTLAGLFAIVVTGLVPGVLVGLGWSLLRDARERRAYRRGELYARPRMPATLLMTLISIGGVAIGVWALTVVLSVMSGFEADLKRKILGQTADGMLLTYGQNELTEWHGVRDRVLKVKGVTGVTPILYNEVMLSAGQNLTGAVLKAIDVPTVGTVTQLPRSIEEGKLAWLQDASKIPLPAHGGDEVRTPAPAGRPLPGIVLGRELARQLRVFVGDQVNVVSPLGDLGPAGPQPKSRVFRVAAIFYSGMFEYDSKFAYIELGEGQRFFGTGEAITAFEVKVHDPDAARQVMQRVVFDLGGWPFRARDWGELNRSLFSALQMEKVVMAVILGFIVLVATFTILATLVMLVLEKRKEIGVLKSMGAGVPSVMKIFVAEGLIIGAVGTAFGLILGYGTCLLVDKVGIPLDPEVYYISNLPVVIDPSQFVLVALAALALSYLATLYPATKAARLHPVDGLRSE
jgi:lipoprotein-releasing system permease protein